MGVAPRGLEREDRIADELSRTVIGHVAAATGLVQLDAASGELGRIEADVLGPTTAAQRHDWRVLEQQ